MDPVLIDVRDVDYTWFEGVKAYLDRDYDIYYLPKESADRLGEPDEDSDAYFLIDGRVQAEADEIEVDGAKIPVWSVRVAELLTRPAKQSA